MNAVHIKTSGFYCKACPKVVEKALGAVEGVEDVVSVHSMGLTSVLFDAGRVDAASLCERIKAAGFGAEIHCPHRSADSPEGPECEVKARCGDEALRNYWGEPLPQPVSQS